MDRRCRLDFELRVLLDLVAYHFCTPQIQLVLSKELKLAEPDATLSDSSGTPPAAYASSHSQMTLQTALILMHSLCR